MKDKEIKQVIEAGNFAINNGKVIRNINVLMGKWVKLESVADTLYGLSSSEIQESLQYLQLANYIDIRDCQTRKEIDVSEADYRNSETRLSEKGIRLAKYLITDEAVKV